MALNVRISYTTGSTLRYSVEKLSNGYFYDFNDSTFKVQGSVTTLVSNLTEGTGSLLGRYSGTIASTPTNQWSDGDYVLSIHDGASSNQVLAVTTFVMRDGSDATFLAPKVTDIWTTALTESYSTSGSTATGAQLLYALFARAFNWTVDGTTYRAKKLDGTTNAVTVTADSTTNTTSWLRSG